MRYKNFFISNALILSGKGTQNAQQTPLPGKNLPTKPFTKTAKAILWDDYPTDYVSLIVTTSP